MPTDTRQKFCILGAGASGLTVLKNFRQLGIPADCLEKQDEVGGAWYYGQPNSSVYKSAHLISSRRLTEYTDFPMPDDYPHYPSQEQAWEYLKSYARHFGLHENIEFNTGVERVEPAENGWDVTLTGGATRRYAGVVIANGHHWDPLVPSYPGHFEGLVLHSAQYKTPDVLAGRRVLVIGGGNSGCDIAVEASRCAAKTLHSTRRGYHYLPKFALGSPADQVGETMLRWRLPLWLRRLLMFRVIKVSMGTPQDFGLPKPDHKLLESHPIINSQMLYCVGHGTIAPRPDVAEFCGREVRFVDGSREPVDVIVYATGFKLSFPFIEREHLNWQDGRPQLFLHAFHPEYDTLFVAGMIQPDSGLWGIVDEQAQLMARFVRAQRSGAPQADWFRKLKAQPAGRGAGPIRYVKTPRHMLEVEHFGYRRQLRKLIARFGK